MKKRRSFSPVKKWLAVLFVLCIGFLVYDIASGDSLGFIKDEIPVVSPAEEQSPNANENQTEDTQEEESAPAADTFSGDYQMERERVRAQELELIQQVIDDKTSAEKVKTEAQEHKLAIANDMEKELQLETLLAAKGYKDAVAFIQEKQITVVIGSEVDDQAAAQIADLVNGTTGIGYENVIIMQKK